MAIRVDDIVVSDKNIIIMHDGRQLIAGISKDTKQTNSLDYNCLSFEDGSTVYSLFDADDFTIRTSILTGGSTTKSVCSDTHETFYMPNPESYAGITQFYDSAYSVCNKTNDVFSYDCETTRSSSEVLSSDTSIVRYSPLTAYDNMGDYYIQPDVAITNDMWCQYMFEYPLSRSYYNFGSFSSDSKPTIYSDCYALKNHLDETYSVNSYTVQSGNAVHEHFRTYYGIGQSGDSIYLVYRNNQNGSSTVIDYKPTEDKTISTRIISSEILKTGYMPNYTATLSAETIFVGSSPYSDFTNGEIITSKVGKFDYIKQPHDNSFILAVYYNNNNTTLYFIPRNSTDSSIRTMTIEGEQLKSDEIVQFENSIVIPTSKHGIIVVKDYLYDITTGSTNSFSTSPFTYSKIGSPNSDNLVVLDENSEYSNFKLFYNNLNILAATATKTVSNTNYRICILSTTTSSDTGKNYSIGELFMLAGTPGLTAFNDKECSVNSNANILFDYSSYAIDDIYIGSYTFVQFSGYGLAKCHVDDIFANNDFVHMTTTGPSNRTTDDSIVAIEVRFNTLSYGGDLKNKLRTMSDFIGNSSTNGVIYGSPALVVTYRDADNYINSTSLLPISEERDLIVENLFNGSESPSAYAEQRCIDKFSFMKDCPIENSCAVNVKTFRTNTINHDSAISLVKWNTVNGKYNSSSTYEKPSDSIGGLHLQYCGTCSEVLITGRKDSTSGGFYSTIYEYPHPCYGNLKTAGTGLPIFEGELDDSMTIGDISIVNNYVVVSNYCVKSMTPSEQTIDNVIKDSGKTYAYQTGKYPSGGYVVTNFFTGEKSTITDLYDSVLKISNIESGKSSADARYNYEYLWHIKPTSSIEFYPASEEGVAWRPYYSGKHVDGIHYYNGYYYIILSDSKTKTNNTLSYDVIETRTLFSEQDYSSLPLGKYVSGIKFFDDNVCVEYSTSSTHEVKWFKQGHSSNKSNMIVATEANVDNNSSINRGVLSLYNDTSEQVVARYDNVEVVKSLNKFMSNVCHKSNIFSIRIEDLGLDESQYLSDYQKTKLKTWFKNKITNIVNLTKPANTQLFDVEL